MFLMTDTGKNKIEFQIDEEDYFRVSLFSWYLNNRYIKTHFNGQIIYLHVFIVGASPEGLVWDHIDGDTYNNRKSNLRAVTIQDNLLNRHKASKASSKIAGVYKHRDRWDVYIPAHKSPLKKSHFIGTFNTLEEAIAIQEFSIKALNDD